MNAEITAALAACVEMSRQAADVQNRMTAALEAALTATQVQAFTPQAPVDPATNTLVLDEGEWDGWVEAEFQRTCTNRALRRALAKGLREAGLPVEGREWYARKAHLVELLAEGSLTVEQAIAKVVAR